MTRTRGTSRTVWLDAAKAIAIMLVVLGHVIRGLYDDGIFADADAYMVSDNAIYLFHMPAFFLISGMLFRHRDWRTFASRSAWNIVLPYFLWAIVIISLRFVLDGGRHVEATVQTILSLPVQPYSIFWFLYALLGIQVVAQFALRYRNGAQILLGLGILTLAASQTLALSKAFALNEASTYLIYFAVGHLLQAEPRKNRASPPLAWACLLGLLVLDASAVWLGMEFNTLQGRSIGLILSLLFAGVFIFAPTFPMWSSLRRIGESTIAIYCMHTIFTSGARTALGKVGIDSLYIHIPAGFVIGIVAPLIALGIARRLHIQKLLGFGASPQRPADAHPTPVGLR